MEYESWKSRREKAFETLSKARKLERLRERLVKIGAMRKVVTYDESKRLTRIHYEPIAGSVNEIND